MLLSLYVDAVQSIKRRALTVQCVELDTYPKNSFYFNYEIFIQQITMSAKLTFKLVAFVVHYEDKTCSAADLLM